MSGGARPPPLCVSLEWNSTTTQLHGGQGERHGRARTGRFGALKLGLAASDTCNQSRIFEIESLAALAVVSLTFIISQNGFF